MAPGDDQETNGAPGSGPGPGTPAGGKRRAPGSLFVLAAVVVGAAVPLCRGLLSPAPSKALAADRPPAAAPIPGQPVPVPPVSPGQPAGQPPLPTGKAGASPLPSAPPVDPRVARALNTRVYVQSGKASFWTELRRVGVGLTWPQGGEPQWTLDERLFNRGLRRLARRVERGARNARLLHTANGFRALPSHPGRVLDRVEARRQLMAALSQPAFRQSLEAAPPGKPAPLKLLFLLREVPPAVTADHLGGINTLLATYSTGLGGSSSNRRHNIRVACAAIDGTVLRPGELFSYNQTVGPRTESAGFQTAPVIIHGELVPGTGGGVCQVSSTLYNVALLGDLKIVRRTHHHFPVHYVPPGRDATVAYDSLDLRFANSLPGPVALDVKTAGSRVVVRLYGTAACKRDVRLITSRTIRAHRRPSSSGSPHGPGKHVIVTRVVRRDDGTVRREVISHDTYAPPPPSARGSSSRHRRGRHRRSAGKNHPEPPQERSPATSRVVRASQTSEGQ